MNSFYSENYQLKKSDGKFILSLSLKVTTIQIQ